MSKSNDFLEWIKKGIPVHADRDLTDITQDLVDSLQAILDYEDDLPPEGSRGDEIYKEARVVLNKAKAILRHS